MGIHSENSLVCGAVSDPLKVWLSLASTIDCHVHCSIEL